MKLELTMTALTLRRAAPGSASRRLLLGSIAAAARAFATLDTWRQRQKSRAQFAELDARTLRDAGISDAQRFIEGNKPFWEA